MRIGFIGAGKMGGAIIKGLLDSEFVESHKVMASEINAELAKKVADDFGINVVTDNNELVANSDVIVICTKPFVIDEVLSDLSPVQGCKLFISIAAGVTTQKIQHALGAVPVIRVMPNTPSLLGEGMSVISGGEFARSEHLSFANEMFEKIGKTAIVDESLIDAATGISGSGPAFMYLLIEAFAKGGVELGLDVEVAQLLASQTAIGAAKMIMETGKTPFQLRKEVTTPGGCTEVGLGVLANNKVEDICIETVKATAQKAKELG